MAVHVAGGLLESRKLAGGIVQRLRRGALDRWTIGGGGPAPGHYIHSVWGDTSKLTPAPALQGNYLRVTDIDRGKDSGSDPNGKLWEEVGGDGQIVRGGWLTATLAEGTTLVSGGRVYVVVIDGADADVWIDGNLDGLGNPRPDIDYHIHVQNVRTLRMTGLKGLVTDIRTIAGAHPDSGSAATFTWYDMDDGLTPAPSGAGGFEEWIVVRDTGDQTFLHVEGCDFDLAHGGVVDSKRTDFIGTNTWGTANNTYKGGIVLQNSRVRRIASTLADSHADLIHVQNDDVLWAGRYISSENFVMSSMWQGYQIDYVDTPQQPNNLLHMRWYNTRLAKLLNTAGNLIFLSHVGAAQAQKPSIEFEGNNYYGKTGAPFYENVTDAGTPNPTVDSAYHTARSNIERYMDYGNGLTQANMSNADGARVLQNLHFEQRDDGVLPVTEEEMVPPGSVGNNYVSLWNAAGELLAEA